MYCSLLKLKLDLVADLIKLGMKPKFKTQLAWEQTQILIQPALIRVVDNLRKYLETSSWQGSYQEVQSPVPGYHLCLTKANHTLELDLWQLCYQICFSNYHPEPKQLLDNTNTDEIEVEIDERLIDPAGEVDWQLLETKTQQLVKSIFASLP